MRDLFILLVHLITIVFRLVRPGGLRSVVAESVLIKHQLLIVNRNRRRAPNLRVLDRLITGFCSLWVKPTRLLRAAIVLRPSTVLQFNGRAILWSAKTSAANFLNEMILMRPLSPSDIHGEDHRVLEFPQHDGGLECYAVRVVI